MEYNEYKDRVYSIITAKPLDSDKERNDVKFVEAVRNYQNTGNVYPVVLTCDKLLTDVCVAMGVDYFHFRLPRTILSSDATSRQMCNQLAYLACVLGFIQLDNVVLLGEYRGKNEFDELSVGFLNNQIPEKLSRDLEICRGLSVLDIRF